MLKVNDTPRFSDFVILYHCSNPSHRYMNAFEPKIYRNEPHQDDPDHGLVTALLLNQTLCLCSLSFEGAKTVCSMNSATRLAMQPRADDERRDRGPGHDSKGNVLDSRAGDEVGCCRAGECCGCEDCILPFVVLVGIVEGVSRKCVGTAGCEEDGG